MGIRTIMFKGKRVDKGEWVEGYMLMSEWNDSVYIVTQDECNYNAGDYIFDGSINKVIPETVGQYTGLTDKNGTKIFEGDIIAGAVRWLERRKNGVVAFRDGSYGLIWYRGDVEQFNAFTSMCNIEYEIIGNIHDNPELLKGETNA